MGLKGGGEEVGANRRKGGGRVKGGTEEVGLKGGREEVGQQEEGGRRRKAQALTDAAANQHHVRVMRQPFRGNYRPETHSLAGRKVARFPRHGLKPLEDNTHRGGLHLVPQWG